ncbi:Y-family DNA polymerase [Corynebacterium gerontici]|uniref:DNA polymerase IV n=1 Tax=Corynebacterium gerontici TaxID=2079234 RepID=A0A3G6IYC2_9CORY|nr:DNA polymerase Y family protein [Corynebacterium gerontici]AZA10781.1 DNA polymerase IV [Corynebacterium gerontici]
MRTLALWFPDWPVQAAIMQGLAQPRTPVMLAAHHRITVCNGAARAQGVRRGMRAREAQAISSATLLDAEETRDAAVFSGIADALDQVASSIEILRPGLALVNAETAGRYHGGEAIAAEKLIDASAQEGMDSFIGIADEIPTAVIAARTQAIVPAGGSREFLAAQPTMSLLEPALGCEEEVVRTLFQLGLRTLGDVADLGVRVMITRFGAAGQRCFDIAAARDERGVAAREERSDLQVSLIPEEPATRVHEAAFLGRALAAQLHDRLQAQGLVCHRLSIRAYFGEVLCQRTWRSKEALSEQAVAERIRWQLDGWLSKHHGDGVGITELVLDPVECSRPDHYALWGAGTDQAARRAITRVQSTLGTDAVLQPHSAGGRGAADRVHMVPFGEAHVVQRAFRGALPAPLPAALAHPSARAHLVDANGKPVSLVEAELSAPPAGFQWGSKRFRVTGWAGPWPVDDQWWKGEGTCARLQIVAEGPHAWLLVWAGQWRVEASYT